VTGASNARETLLTFTPREYIDRELPPLKRPRFLYVAKRGDAPTPRGASASAMR
jgi:hypothetical protein